MPPANTHRLHLQLPIAFALLVALLAGCAGPAPPPVEDVAPDPVPTSLVQLGPEAGPDLAATTAAAPRLVEGEWWKIRFDGAF